MLWNSPQLKSHLWEYERHPMSFSNCLIFTQYSCTFLWTFLCVGLIPLLLSSLVLVKNFLKVYSIGWVTHKKGWILTPLMWKGPQQTEFQSDFCLKISNLLIENKTRLEVFCSHPEMCEIESVRKMFIRKNNVESECILESISKRDFSLLSLSCFQQLAYL